MERVKEIVRIELDRPRDRTSTEYNFYQRKLYDFLKDERLSTGKGEK